jgi:hypothetical protein
MVRWLFQMKIYVVRFTGILNIILHQIQLTENRTSCISYSYR